MAHHILKLSLEPAVDFYEKLSMASNIPPWVDLIIWKQLEYLRVNLVTKVCDHAGRHHYLVEL